MKPFDGTISTALEEIAEKVGLPGAEREFYNSIAKTTLGAETPGELISTLIPTFEMRDNLSPAEQDYLDYLYQQEEALEANPDLMDSVDMMDDLRYETVDLLIEEGFEDLLTPPPLQDAISDLHQESIRKLRDHPGIAQDSGNEEKRSNQSLPSTKPSPDDGLLVIEVPDYNDSGEACLPASRMIGYAQHTSGMVRLYVRTGDDEGDIYEMQPHEEVILHFTPSNDELIITVADLIKDPTLAMDASLIAVIEMLAKEPEEAMTSEASTAAPSSKKSAMIAH